MIDLLNAQKEFKNYMKDYNIKQLSFGIAKG